MMAEDRGFVNIILPVFGGRELRCRIEIKTLLGKTIDCIVDKIVQQDWAGDDKRTAELIRKNMRYFYSMSLGYGYPPHFEPVKNNCLFDALLDRYLDSKKNLMVFVAGPSCMLG